MSEYSPSVRPHGADVRVLCRGRHEARLQGHHRRDGGGYGGHHIHAVRQKG